MTYFTYLYLLPAVVFLITCEVMKKDDPIGGKEVVLAAMFPGINLILGLLSIAVLFCKLMIWYYSEEEDEQV